MRMLRVLFVPSYLQVNYPIRIKNAYEENDNDDYNALYSWVSLEPFSVILSGGKPKMY